jgi:hypothetical protein
MHQSIVPTHQYVKLAAPASAAMPLYVIECHFAEQLEATREGAEQIRRSACTRRAVRS